MEKVLDARNWGVVGNGVDIEGVLAVMTIAIP